MLKLYVLVRNDIDIPFQMCQVAHAVANFATAHPAEFKAWNTGNNTICVLQTKDDKELTKYVDIAKDAGLKFTEFWEPDAASVGFEGGYDPATKGVKIYPSGPYLTAVAFAPDWFLQNTIFTTLPLALNEKAVMAKVGLRESSKITTQREYDRLLDHSSQLRSLKCGTRKFRRNYFKTAKGD